MKSTPLLDIVELLIQRDKLEAIVAEGGDKVGEQRLKLQRAQRDVTDFSGRLKYGTSGGITATDVADLKQKGDAAVEAASQATKQLASLELDSKNAADDLHNVRQQIDSLMNQLKMRYCATSLSEKATSGSSRASPRQHDDDGGGSKQPIAASFTENVHKITDELRLLLVGGGKHPFLKLFINDPPPINDAAPHYSSWEQRTLTTIFNSKEKVLKIHQRLTDAVNACAVYYPDLAKNSALWTDFVDLCDDSFLVALLDNIERALALYERALGGKSAPELFSVNLKLTAACRVQLVPTAHDLPNHVVSLVEEKLFSIIPPNTIGDVVSAPTTHKSGKGVPLKKILADKGILSKLEVVKNHVARYGEELVAAVVKIEDRFLQYWNQDAIAKMSIFDLRNARDEVDFSFGYVRQRIFGGAFQLNAFPLQDTLSALLTAQIDARRQLEANTSDDMLQQMIKTSTLANARAFSVPVGGLAALLQKNSGNSPSAKKSDEWSDRFDPVKYVDQLVASQIKSAYHSTQYVAPKVVSPLTPKANAAVPARSAASRDEKENVLRSSTEKTPHPQHPVEGAVLREPARINSSTHNTGTGGKVPTTAAVGSGVLGTMASPRPSSTPSNGTRTSITTQNFSLTPNRVLGKQASPRDPQQETSSVAHGSGIRSAEVLKASAAAYTEHTQPSRPNAWDSPKNADSQPKRDKPRRIDLPREPDHAPVNTLVSPYREKQATPPTVPISTAHKPERELTFDDSSALNTSNQQAHDERRAPPRGILKATNAPVTPPEQPAKRPPFPTDDDDDEYTLQRLLQKEKESLERIRVMKERDDARRREIQAAHRKGVVTEETLKKVSPRSEYQALLEEQARLENARRDNEAKLREAEKEARRVREEQDHQRQLQLEEEDRQQRQWEEQLRQQHEENARRRAREKQAADEAERDALRRKLEEEEKRRQYQKDLEDRLEEELRRRAFQQQREREERELERIRREQELHQAQEGERLRQRAALDRLRQSPVPQHDSESEHVEGESSGYLPSVQETSALRRKLSLPPVQASLDGRPATPPMVPLPDVSLSARSRKPNTAPHGTPRGSIPPDVPRSTTAFGQSMEVTPRERMAPIPSSGALPERSLLDEYKQYCLNFGIKPNSGLLKSLPSVVGDFATSINLDLNYIGVKGVQPLLQILKRNRGLKLLNLKDNNLENNEVRALVNVLLTDSGASLTHLDLSNNPISLAGGSAIMDLVSQKKSLTTVVLRGTLIQPKVVEKIVEAAESNRRRAAWNSGSD